MRKHTQLIDENKCMGDTLETFNDNYENLDNAVQSLSTSFISTLHCEGSGNTVDQFLSHGDATTNHIGLRMPYRGELLAAALQVSNMTGTVTVDPTLSGTTFDEFRLTTGAQSNYTGGTSRRYEEPGGIDPLQFSQDDVIGWKIITAPSVGTYTVTYVVKMYL